MPPPDGGLEHRHNKVTWPEFKRCVCAIFAFGVGYKQGEGYDLGYILAPLAYRADAEAFNAGYALSMQREPYK